MVKGLGLSTLALLVAIVGLVGLWSSPARAQEDPGGKIISFEAQNADVRETLRNLFKQIGVSYSIAPEVQGTITVQLQNVSFDVALQNVVRQVDSTYRIEGGVYQIVRKDQPAVASNRVIDGGYTIAPARGQRQAGESVTITQDEKFLYILRGDTLYKVNKGDLKTVTSRKLGD